MVKLLCGVLLFFIIFIALLVGMTVIGAIPLLMLDAESALSDTIKRLANRIVEKD